jgi:hypothetical protein
MAAVQQRERALAQHRDLRGPILGLFIEHAKHRPVRAGIGDLRHVAPGQRDAVAAVDRAQVPRRVGIEEMPIGVGRHLGHAPHDHRRRQLDLLARFHPVAFPCQEAPERDFRTQQGAGKEAAFKIPPRVQYILRVHAGGCRRRALGAARHLAAGGMGRPHAVAAMQDLVRDMRGEVEFQARGVLAQPAVQVHRVRRLEERAHHAANLPVLVPREHGLPIEPAQLEAMALAQARHVGDGQGKLALTDILRRALEIREIVARRLLIGTDQQVRELPPGRAGLGQQFRDGRLQELLREEESGLERDRGCASRALLTRTRLDRGTVVEEPGGAALKDAGEQAKALL